MKAIEKLDTKIGQKKHICVGLDTDPKKIPQHLLSEENPVLAFNKAIIEATCQGAAAFKLNFAFYEAEGINGLSTLKRTIEYIHEKDSTLLVIGDAKRADIGNSSKKYAQALFDKFNVDASTLHPYMGTDSLKPFIEYKEKLHFILALTSNPSAMEFEKLELKSGGFVFQEIIKKVHEWDNDDNCGLVFGATNPEELEENMELIGRLPVLLPGIGAQGGSLEKTVKTFCDHGRLHFLINSSRGIIYKDNTENFAEVAHEEVNKLNNAVREIR